MASMVSELFGIHLVVMPEKEDAAYVYNDLVNLLGSDNVLFFPSSFKRSVHYNQIDNGSIILRTNVVNRLGSDEKYVQGNSLIVVTYAEGLAEKVITQVNETDFLRINQGQGVIVRLDALPSVTFDGKVSYIGKLCRTKDRTSRQKIFDVEVTLLAPDERLKPGMTVSCEFQ